MENDLMLSGAPVGHRQHNQAASPEATHSGSPSGNHSRIDAGSLDSDALVPLSEATRQFQVAHIEQAIAACNGNMTDAAARLGLHRSNLYRKMRQLGMQTSGE